MRSTKRRLVEAFLECKLSPLACGPGALSMGHNWELIGLLMQFFWGHKKTELRGIKVSVERPINERVDKSSTG